VEKELTGQPDRFERNSNPNRGTDPSSKAGTFFKKWDDWKVPNSWQYNNKPHSWLKRKGQER
jgi:hypothetical protein